MRSEALLQHFKTLHPHRIDLDLNRVERLLGCLGCPHHHLPPLIHVAGTNGKGSTIAFLRALLESCGHTVHVYTSPHLVRFHERIVVCGQDVSEEQLVESLEICQRENAGEPITFFEIVTCAAFLLFSRIPADFVLLETGLGGRLDATNVVKSPVATVLTPISLDHQAMLGDSLPSIAREKAFIQKENVTSIAAQQPSQVMSVLQRIAQSVGARPLYYGHHWTLEGSTLIQGDTVLSLPPLSLFGPHQRMNAATAVLTARVLQNKGKLKRPLKSLEGLQHAVWPGRLQRVRKGPLVTHLLPGQEVWLDGGHNVGGGEALAECARVWNDRPLYLAVAMLSHKDHEGFLRPLVPYVRRLWALDLLKEEGALSPEDLCAVVRGLGLACTVASLTSLGSIGSHPYRLLFCGSLTLVGEILKLLGCESAA